MKADHWERDQEAWNFHVGQLDEQRSTIRRQLDWDRYVATYFPGDRRALTWRSWRMRTGQETYPRGPRRPSAGPKGRWRGGGEGTRQEREQRGAPGEALRRHYARAGARNNVIREMSTAERTRWTRQQAASDARATPSERARRATALENRRRREARLAS